jgi:hypothetical protein
MVQHLDSTIKPEQVSDEPGQFHPSMYSVGLHRTLMLSYHPGGALPEYHPNAAQFYLSGHHS